ncbi:MAG: YbaB/EbfC family nucleoid-associated protein [Acidobacteria bacterium]|nr:YbaB/EbfC family nucleoid-associated protein [Acidobacteriota bacterium]
MKNLQQLMKQAQQMQEKLQKEMSGLEVEASSGGGMVVVKMSGNKLVTQIRIDPEALAGSDVEMLQDLMVAAVNEASRKVDEALAEQLGSMASAFKLPGLF